MNTFIEQFKNLLSNEDAFMEFLAGNMVICVLLFILGLVLIMVGGDRFVDASIVISRKLGIPQIIVGATIVSLGTTLPEILTSATAAFSGEGDMAIGNAYGSIVCNTALIAAITQLCKPSGGVERSSISWRSILFFVTYGVVSVVGLATGGIPRWLGWLLILGFCLYAFLSVKMTGGAEVKAEGEPEKEAGKKEEGSVLAAVLIMVICAALLFFGSKLLVNGGQVIAAKAGVPSGVIAVTFVALGTSLPELVTAITSLIKGYADVSLGNIIGANTLNLLLVVGIPAAVRGIQIRQMNSFYMTAPTGLLVMLILILPFWFKKRGYRLQGAALIAIYAVYCVMQFMYA